MGDQTIINLFQKTNFISHSSLPLGWKIEADALSKADWETIADFVAPALRPFKYVLGVPNGGLAFAAALEYYKSNDGGLLLVDDVLTTGGSMEEAKRQLEKRYEIQGVVLFNRGLTCPDWISPVFSLNPIFNKEKEVDKKS